MSAGPPPHDAELEALRERVRSLEAALRQREREHATNQTLLQTVPAIVMRVSLDGTIESINRVLPEYEALPPVGRSIYTFAPPDQHALMREALERTARTRSLSSFESVAEAPDGSRDWYLTWVGPILEEGELVGFSMVSTNATRAHAAEAALVESSAKLELALDAGNFGIWRWDKGTDLVAWDERITAMFGLPPGAGPRTVAEYLALIPADQRQAMAEHIQGALATGVYRDFELRLERPDGPRFLIIRGGMLRGPDGEINGLLGGVVDVTERRRVEERLRQTQKLEALGQLSAGVAHNFNNMLAVILPTLELLRAKASPEDLEMLDDALVSTGNAAELVRRLMVFTRSGPAPSSRREPFADVIRRAVNLCAQTFGPRVELVVGDLSPARFAQVESSAMEQAMMNLLINARDATAASPAPRITIATRRLEGEAALRSFERAHGAYVELSIVDNGAGMDATTRRRMLEPFFTTKGPGAGTGLGLSTTWATVEAHRGYLECESELGRGARFVVLVPAEDAQVDAAPPAPPTRPVGHGQTVLVVDDELPVLRATAALLTACGYRALTASSGEQALAVAGTVDVDAVVLDVSMPGLPPQAALAALRSADPALPVISLSGLGVQLEGATSHLVKPVGQQALAEALQRALADRR